jgi:23S rRNA pseudouridine2605 synthase
MRINKFVARATGLSRRAADSAIGEGRVTVNRQPATPGTDVNDTDTVTLDNKPLALPAETTTIMLNKPAGYVCSRAGQGNQTVYDLLPANMQQLKPVGRLDKDSSGLLLLTNDGDLANQLTHPRYAKEKAYEVTLDKPLANEHKTRLGQGVELDDGPSKLKIDAVNGRSLKVTMSEGRNRQIRRTFAALGYTVTKLNRIQFGPYRLDQLAPTQRYQIVYTV